MSEYEDDSMAKVDCTEIGVNTDELPPEVLQKLVDENKELLEEASMSNIEHEIKDSSSNINPNQISTINYQRKNELIEELNEKDKIFDLLVKSNTELKKKIELSTAKYQEILEKVKEKENEKTEGKLSLQIKEMEKEINANNSETEHYKKWIDQLKNKIEFKSNWERAFNWQNIYKQESMKNADLKNQINSLLRVNGVQLKYINNYDKENQISEKLDILKSEIKQTKDSIKDYQDKYTKQDRFIRWVHEKILSLEMMIKKMKEPKIEKTKWFTREELKSTWEAIASWKTQITENRNKLNSLTKENDNKMHLLLAQNKQIEIDFKENEKINKMWIFKKNELKRNIKNSNFGNANNTKKAPKRTNIISKNDNPKKIEDSKFQSNIMGTNSDENQEVKNKLFSKNPNREMTEEFNNYYENENDKPSWEGDNMENDINDSNWQMNNQGSDDNANMENVDN